MDESHADGLARVSTVHAPRGVSWPKRCPTSSSPGHHAAIARWRRKESLRRTLERRPELLDGADSLIGRPGRLLDEMRGRSRKFLRRRRSLRPSSLRTYPSCVYPIPVVMQMRSLHTSSEPAVGKKMLPLNPFRQISRKRKPRYKRGHAGPSRTPTVFKPPSRPQPARSCRGQPLSNARLSV